MTIDEIYEDIRALLREPQLNLSDTQWEYTDAELNVQIRGAMRRLQNLDLTDVTVTTEGVFSAEPTLEVGLLVSYYVASRLLAGDLIQKLQDGELGLVFRAGTDLIDTKTASKQLKDAADEYREEYQVLLTRALTPSTGATQIYGEQEVPPT